MTEVEVYSYIVYAVFSHPIYLTNTSINQEVVKPKKKENPLKHEVKAVKGNREFLIKSTYCI